MFTDSEDDGEAEVLIPRLRLNMYTAKMCYLICKYYCL